MDTIMSKLVLELNLPCVKHLLGVSNFLELWAMSQQACNGSDF